MIRAVSALCESGINGSRPLALERPDAADTEIAAARQVLPAGPNSQPLPSRSFATIQRSKRCFRRPRATSLRGSARRRLRGARRLSRCTLVRRI